MQEIRGKEADSEREKVNQRIVKAFPVFYQAIDKHSQTYMLDFLFFAFFPTSCPLMS